VKILKATPMNADKRRFTCTLGMGGSGD